MSFSKRLMGALGALLIASSLLGCANGAQTKPAGDASQASESTTLVDDFHNDDLGNGMLPFESMELSYARRFTIDSYDGHYKLICLADGARYLVVPKDAQVPDGLASDIVVLQQPVSNIYLAASDSMCLFDALHALDAISVSGIERDKWSIPAAQEAMDAGKIVYGGSYRSPDYELLASRGVELAIESTMINHAPEVRDKLNELGIPVFTECSSHEEDPLGRAEWVKLYGVLLGKEEVADAAFQHQVDLLNELQQKPTNKKVAYFYLNSNGAAVVRRPGDYVTKMIEKAGGQYAFDGLEASDSAASSVTLQMEDFFSYAKDADVLIYNASIDGGVTSLKDLTAKNELLAQCKAVKKGDVWVTSQDMYQQMLDVGTITSDFQHALLGEEKGLTYLRRLK